MIRAPSAGLLAAMLFVGPAAAGHCPPGQFYRVRLNLCVGVNTRLASAYVHIAASRPPGGEPEAGPVDRPEDVIPFVLPTLDDWPAPK
jgi:hypothetical protein